MLLKLNSKGEDVFLLQELYNEMGYNLVVDGHFGKKTEDAVKDFQLKNGLVSDGTVGTKTWTMLMALNPNSLNGLIGKLLSEADVVAFAAQFGVELAVVKAVQEVESGGRGFLLDGRPKILFEGHIFWNQLAMHGLNPSIFHPGNENVLYLKSTRAFYLGGKLEYNRLGKAQNIRPDGVFQEASHASCSWGMYQIMGFNHQAAGHSTLEGFIQAMHTSEGEHLRAFGNFIQHHGLIIHLKKKNWEAFAKAYNGSGYKRNRYHTKLAAAYKRYAAL